MPFASAATLTVVAGIVGAFLDTVHGAPAHTLFALLLSAGAGAAVLTVHRPDVVRVVVLVPLAYLGLLVVGGIAAHDGDYVVWLASSFVYKAPVVLFATGTAVVLAAVRRVRG